MELSLDGLSLDTEEVSLAEAAAAELQRSSATLLSLTHDCILCICRHLRPWPDISALSLTCRKFARVATHCVLWSELVLSDSMSKRQRITDATIVALARRAGHALQVIELVHAAPE